MVGAPIVIVRVVRRGRLLLEYQINANLDSREVLRFNIWHAVVFTTVVSVLLAIGKALLASGGSTTGNVSVSEYFKIGVAGATFGICSVVVVWATLGKQPFERNFVSCFVTIGLGLLNGYFMDGGGPDGWIWFAIGMVVWLEMTFLMWLVRSEGYRFVVASEDQ